MRELFLLPILFFKKGENKMKEKYLKFLGVGLIFVVVFIFNSIRVWAEGSLVPLSSVVYSGAGNDCAWAIVVDGEGNIIVTGYSYNGVDNDYLTIKYDQNLVRLYSTVYDGDDNDCAYGIAVDSNDNIFVAGSSSNSISGDDYFTIKYDSTLAMISSTTYDGGNNDCACGVVVDVDENIIVTGTSNNGTDDDYFTIKYDQELAVVSSVTYDGGGSDCAQAVAVDSDNNIIVTGMSNDNYFTIKYNEDFNVISSIVYDGPNLDCPQGIAVDSNNNIIVTGFSYNGITGLWDYFTIKYNPNFNQLCAITYDGGNREYAQGIAVDGEGNIVVTGSSHNGENKDYFTIKYDQNLVVLSSVSYNGTANNNDGAYGVAVDGEGNVIVTGYSYNTISGNDYFTIKYNGISPGISSVSPSFANQGTTLDVIITGSNFFSEAEVVFGGSGVTVNSVEFISATELKVNITLAKEAVIGRRDITVTNIDGLSGTFVDGFEIETSGWVRIQGGEDGYVNPNKGEGLTIHFDAAHAGTVKVKIYTLRGQLVWKTSKEIDGEEDFITWDCKNIEGTVVASGVYVVCIDGPGIKDTRKAVILK